MTNRRDKMSLGRIEKKYIGILQHQGHFMNTLNKLAIIKRGVHHRPKNRQFIILVYYMYFVFKCKQC